MTRVPGMTTILLYGDTVRSPALRHEVPLEIVDPFLYVARDDEAFVLTSALELARIQATLPRATVQLRDSLGWFELIEEGMPREEADLEVAVRALREWGVEEAVVPGDLPVAVADRLRDEGLRVEVDSRTVQGRRRVKSPAELDGIRRAQRAAEAGMAAAEQLIRGAGHAGEDLEHEGEPLTAETVRAAVRAACAAAGAPAPPDIMVVSLRSGGGHDPGSGPLPAGLPITIDLWPRDDASGCWADMTRTFVNGEVTAEIAALRDVARAALEAARDAGATGDHRPRALRRRRRDRRTGRVSRPSARARRARRCHTASTSASDMASGSRSTSRRGWDSPAGRRWWPETWSRSSREWRASKASAVSASRICCSSPRTGARRSRTIRTSCRTRPGRYAGGASRRRSKRRCETGPAISGTRRRWRHSTGEPSVPRASA